MILDFAVLPPEINSARIFSGAGSSPLFTAAAAWEGLGADLQSSVSAIQSLLTDLTGGPWTGPASMAMAAAAAPYVSWLSAAAAQAELSAGQARAAATAFETALAATVHPAAVDANRVSLLALIATNFLGQNTPAIAATEFDYVEMWAQDVGAMVAYYTGATSVASTLTPFSTPPVNLAGLASQVGAQVAGAATAASAAVSPVLQGAAAGVPGAVTAVQSAAAAVPMESVMSVAQIGMYPASMMLGPLMQLGQSANASTAGLASAGMAAADLPKFAGDVAPAMKGLGGGAGMGAAADLGKARLVGAMSVPPTWEGSMPKGMASSAMSGLGAMPTAAELAQAGPAGGGMPMMPMPMGAGAGAGMPGGMMGRGGANPHVVQQRPSVVPRTGIG
ncbi:putative PPE family protein PPE38 [Mycobacterium simulans]|uniref:Putative PPE family protein PPE38 n=1 Tax=Mycobacterium simulans TaxID=627089 RepID=A0A7Z7IM40_9MYCO|nr:PPE family protein [Mycobacterium simulans]SOJ56127.1 putative PPE family protein PPE38 [Mycobacterium simulans]SON64035.1 putative PPE family protein PPE38 [Mycobacterium simulans]